jgi:PAS domain S-box-containing protein
MRRSRHSGCAALIREDKAIGAIIVQADPEQLFTNEDIEQASAFALQAAIAIENARLYQETLGLQSFSDAIVQSIQQGIVVLEKDMRVRLVNAYVRRTFGWTDEAIGKFLFEYRPKYETFLTSRIENVLRSGHPDTQYDVKQTDERGQTSVLNFYVYPLLQRDVVNGIVLLIEDVTTRAALEADIETRARQLSVLTEASGQLTATLQTQAVVKLVLDQLERILDFDSVTLWLRERRGWSSVPRALHER